MNLRFAFAGFRHSHIFELYNLVRVRDDLVASAAVEEHPETAKEIRTRGVVLTHTQEDELFGEPDAFDVLAIGDCYGRRGSLALRGLEAGKHIIADKPLCTRLVELERIALLSGKSGLSVGCMLNQRNSAQLLTMKRLVGEGIVGKVQTVSFMGQHPLLYGKRSMWYFEEGQHGGTINDIAVHACDSLPWLLQSPIVEIVSARVWNNSFPDHPDFQLCAQVQMRMQDGTGILGDVSYLSPNSQGYTVPHYWRFTLHGTKGIMESSATAADVRLWIDGEEREKVSGLDPERKGGYLNDFVNEIRGKSDLCDSTTRQVLTAARTALMAQKAADEHIAFLRIDPM